VCEVRRGGADAAVVDVGGCNIAERRALSLFPSTGVVDEWFSTVDIGRVDENGYFFLDARKTSELPTSPLQTPGLNS